MKEPVTQPDKERLHDAQVINLLRRLRDNGAFRRAMTMARRALAKAEPSEREEVAIQVVPDVLRAGVRATVGSHTPNEQDSCKCFDLLGYLVQFATQGIADKAKCNTFRDFRTLLEAVMEECLGEEWLEAFSRELERRDHERPLNHGRSRRSVPREAREDPMLEIKKLVRKWASEGKTNREICRLLANSPRPTTANWKHLTWPAAYMHAKFRKSVVKWLAVAKRPPGRLGQQ